MSSRLISDMPAICDRVLTGDTAAWGELVDSYAVLVYSVAIRAGLSEADAEDLCPGCLAGALSWKKFDPGSQSNPGLAD